MPFGRFTVLTADRLHSRGCSASRSPGEALGGDWTSVRKGLEYVDYALLVALVLGFVYWRVRRSARDARAGKPRWQSHRACRRVGTPAD